MSAEAKTHEKPKAHTPAPTTGAAVSTPDVPKYEYKPRVVMSPEEKAAKQKAYNQARYNARTPEQKQKDEAYRKWRAAENKRLLKIGKEAAAAQRAEAEAMNGKSKAN